MKRTLLTMGHAPAATAARGRAGGAIAFAALVAFWLAGCAVQPPPAPVTAAQLINHDPTSQCMRTVNNDPRLAVLIPKVGSLQHAGNADIAMLTSTALPSAEEKTALAYWGSERQRCLGLGKVYRAWHLPAALVATFESGQQNLVFLTARLYAAEISYGQFNTQREELAGAMRQRTVEFEQQRRAARAEAARTPVPATSGEVQQPVAVQQMRPLYTACVWSEYGGVDCTGR